MSSALIGFPRTGRQHHPAAAHPAPARNAPSLAVGDRATAVDLTPRQQHLAAFAVALAVVMVVLDGVMVNVALPSIARNLQASPANAIWVVNAYQLAAALVLLPLGRLADIVGHRRVYLACLLVFTIASAGCAFAGSLAALSVWRFVQGCGGAGIMGITNAMLRFIYPPGLLAKGIGRNSIVVALALASGPTIASLIVQLANWPWLFLINLPIGALLLLIGARSLPVTAGTRHPFDWKSAVLSMATFGLLISALDTKSHAETLLAPILLLVTGLVIGTALVRRQFRIETPLVPVDLLRTRMFGLSVGTMFAVAVAQTMAYVALPFFFQLDLGRSQIQTGLLFLPWPLAIAAISPFAGRLSVRHAPGLLCSIGLLVFATGLALLALLDRGAGVWDITWRMAVCGLGYGFFQPPSTRAMITAAPVERSGSASVMGATGRVLGQATGAALVASIFRLQPGDACAVSLAVAAAISLLAIAASITRGARRA